MSPSVPHTGSPYPCKLHILGQEESRTASTAKPNKKWKLLKFSIKQLEIKIDIANYEHTTWAEWQPNLQTNKTLGTCKT